VFLRSFPKSSSIIVCEDQDSRSEQRLAPHVPPPPRAQKDDTPPQTSRRERRVKQLPLASEPAGSALPLTSHAHTAGNILQQGVGSFPHAIHARR
jgi:hypothetical protein